ncbi:Aste57867_21811 [Aphanomyces stellatus]|uniref:Aste57867_21811 protein n=1 Tax=Aphanomyces stellatus TaxID=120398 RepID=A0A485LII7_9STRA|nr:hypothetical protein As57867_021742 [Aphanomyces stellatus]VFT98480.1 Aste57867_21811 [Aphanomyces stellatus]
MRSRETSTNHKHILPRFLVCHGEERVLQLPKEISDPAVATVGCLDVVPRHDSIIFTFAQCAQHRVQTAPHNMFQCDDTPSSTLVSSSSHPTTMAHKYQVSLDDVDAFSYLDAEDTRPCSPPPPPATLVRSRSTPLASVSTDKPLVHILSPYEGTIWRRGQPLVIQWTPLAASVSEIRIVLRQKSTASTGAYAIVADHVENNGLFVYMRAPVGLCPGSDYFLCIMSMDGKQVVDSECFTVVG